jgi:threonine/homoserine/homoserine lactone efflux protein
MRPELSSPEYNPHFHRDTMNSVYASLIAYVAAASLLTVTPGLDTALVLRTVATRGPRQAALAGVGIAAGCFGWAILVALGLGALLAASQTAYTILRWVGAAYLLWVGYRMLRYPRQSLIPAQGARSQRDAAFSTGLLTNLLNPKVGVFYVSFLPQFVPRGVSVAPYILLLGAIHAILGMIWFACLITATRPLTRVLQRPRVIKACDRLTGGMFVAFGVTLATQRSTP